ncbi:cobalt-precorrin-5B (C(1))-methyltransferase CbiD [Desulfopila inferna]|uniref:cobalt-precorrin-5B (C(1))-methyltransferase CbiD n=1 Tax=Desulfopila inferna TaxID=468528 RepID=UPI0019665CE3|nr:cobalt-precorrin-5B (C(1))-methyltransferase CbiD [Desulfopila inferna]MBM9603672.1 cobalamin biosynthesis protein CbiD [Desulfopila inferna]
MAKRLRSGYTTGACAAAAAKAALITARQGMPPDSVELTFPDGSLHRFEVCRAKALPRGAMASIVKDAGDDPDVTNKAEICATVSFPETGMAENNDIVMENMHLSAGEGVGRITKPGLAVPVGEPAINPVPRQMILKALQEVEKERIVHVSISIPAGEMLAEKTLNKRLGIIGGLSILGTTGIVRPVSADAWKATIVASMNVAREAGLEDIVLSTGRTSEKGAQSLLPLAIEAYAMMGDYLEFSLRKAGEKGFETVHLAGMWAKIMKAAMQIPQTHVRNGALEMQDAALMLQGCDVEPPLLTKLQNSNTAREMYSHLEDAGRSDVVRQICRKARHYGEKISGKKVKVYLVDARAQVVEHV